jgi:hypothetical protein
MQVALASCRSPDAATNEDFVAATASVVVVLDGASVPPGVEAGCVHGSNPDADECGLDAVAPLVGPVALRPPGRARSSLIGLS